MAKCKTLIFLDRPFTDLNCVPRCSVFLIQSKFQCSKQACGVWHSCLSSLSTNSFFPLQFSKSISHIENGKGGKVWNLMKSNWSQRYVASSFIWRPLNINSEGIHYRRASANELIWYSWECQYLSVGTSFIEIQMHIEEHSRII